jgi:hypothetical protein
MSRRLAALLIGFGAVVATIMPAVAQDATLAERVAAIDQVVLQRDGFRVVVGHISRELAIPVETLREQRKKTDLSWGELLLAHRLAREGKTDLDTVVTEFRGGKTWEDIARDHKVDLAQLSALIHRTEATVEARSEDKAPAPIQGTPSAAPPSGRGPVMPGTRY